MLSWIYDLAHFPKEIVRKKIWESSFAAIAFSLFGIIGEQSERVIGSFLSGAFVWFVSNFYFTTKVTKAIYKNCTPRHLLTIFYYAEFFKLVLIGCFFVGMVTLLPISLFLFLLGYLISQVVFWCLIIRSREFL